VFIVGIRIDVTTKKGETISGILNHDDLERCVGDALAAFTEQMMVSSIIGKNF
jgi:hypothetical protein